MGSQSVSLKLPTLRFRGKVMLGFSVVLAITAISMGIAYLGFERVSSGVATYRNSVADLVGSFRPATKPDDRRAGANDSWGPARCTRRPRS